MRLLEISAPSNLKQLYVNRPLLNSRDIYDWAKSQGLPSILSEDDLHVTIVYSKSPIDWDAFTPSKQVLTIKRGRRCVEKFSDKVVVLQFTSNILQGRWQEFIGGGASWDHARYLPHITLTYSGEDIAVSNLEPYQGPITLGPEVFAEIVSDYADSIKETELD